MPTTANSGRHFPSATVTGSDSVLQHRDRYVVFTLHAACAETVAQWIRVLLPHNKREPSFCQVHRHDVGEITPRRYTIAGRVPGRKLRLPERLASAEVQDGLRAVYLCEDFGGNSTFPFGSG